jgi:predicted nucleotidyltransferase
MAELLNLPKLHPEIRNRLSDYCQALISLHGDNIISIFLYGSAVTGDFIPKRSNINLLVIFKTLNFSTLQKSLKLVAKGLRKKIIAPLFLTREHIKTSLDTFPVEFLEIQENYLLLFGEDILKPLKIPCENLRLECEHQIKGKLIRIREAYLEIGLRKKGIEALLKESLNSLLPIFRNMLRLKGITPPPTSKEEIIKKLGSEFKISPEVFINILRDRRGDEKIAGYSAEEYLKRYLLELQNLAQSIDELKV